MKSLGINLSLVVIASAVVLLLTDGVLGLLGFPAEVPPRFSHPPGMEKVRKSVEFEYLFKTNSKGLRYREVPLEKPSGSRRIFVAGDSFTEGVGVEANKRFAALLEDDCSDDAAQEILFINGGLAGTGPLSYLRTFLRIGQDYDPDGLLICLFANDLSDTPREFDGEKFGLNTRRGQSGLIRYIHKIFPHWFTMIQSLIRSRKYKYKTSLTNFIAKVSKEATRRGLSPERIKQWQASVPQHLLDAVESGLNFNLAIFACGLLHPEYWTHSLDISSAEAERKWQVLTRILFEARVRTQQAGIEIAIVFIPSVFQYDPRSHSQENPWVMAGARIRPEWLQGETEIQKRLESWTRSQGLPFLDLTPTGRAAVQAHKVINWKLDGHWNATGHRVAADAIYAWFDSAEVFSFMSSAPVDK